MLCGGNLRVWDTLPSWAGYMSPYLDGLTIQAENAFGTQFCSDKEGMGFLFWPSRLEVEEIGMPWGEMLSLMTADPSIMLEQDIYEQAIEKLGIPTNFQHFAWRVPPEAGGGLVVENLEILDAELDIQRQIEWARALKDLPLGTKLTIKVD